MATSFLFSGAGSSRGSSLTFGRMNEATPMAEWQVWLMDIAPLASTIYSWVLMGAGLVVSVLLARVTRSAGFYLVALFFLSPAFSWGVREVQYMLHREAIDAYVADQNRRIQSGEIIPNIDQSIRFPVFETFLVIGLALVLRASKKPNKSPEPTR